MKSKTLVVLTYVLTALLLILSAAQLFISIPHADISTTWNVTKNAASDDIYFDQTTTFYCDCPMASHGGRDGSCNINM